jgi:hypothetical protein
MKMRDRPATIDVIPRPPSPDMRRRLLSAGIELVEQGFEVVVVKDATAGPRLPEGDGYLAALVNYRFLKGE